MTQLDEWSRTESPAKPTLREGKTGWFKGVLMRDAIPADAPADIKRRVLDALNAGGQLTDKELAAITELEGGAFITDVQEKLGMQPQEMNELLIEVGEATDRILRGEVS